MPYLNNGARPLKSHIRKEVEFEKSVKRGSRGSIVKRIQEWSCLHGHRLVADGIFGPATEAGVKAFQSKSGLNATGTVDRSTYMAFVSPMLRVLEPVRHNGTFADAVAKLAKKHLKEHPREIGGQNRGPWVRLYMDSNEGNAWPWCAGFVTFILKQASELTGKPMPIVGSFSCDVLAMQAKQKGRFCPERDIDEHVRLTGGQPAIFLVRRTSTDWTHTGFAMSFDGEVMDTLEGNTNDEGSREGYEVCERIRSFSSKDLITLG